MQVAELFLVAEITVGKTKKNSDFARGKIQDKTGTIAAKLWDYDTAHGCHLLKPGQVVFIKGIVEEYLGQPDIKIEMVSEAHMFVDQSDFEKASKYQVGQMCDEFLGFVASFEAQLFEDVAYDLISNEQMFEAFCLAPAATGMHHAYKSGLIEHTTQMLKQAQLLLTLPFYKDVLNRDLCMFGVMFHDFGKIFEYSPDAGFKSTIQGALVPHIPMVAGMIYHSCAKLQTPEVIRDYMMHVVLAHHREVAWGSPVSFACPEAAFVHYNDALHGDVFGILQRKADNAQAEIVRHGQYKIVNLDFSTILKELK